MTEMSRFDKNVTKSLNLGRRFCRAKALVESLNRSAIHISILVLFWYGGWLVKHNHIPYRVLVTAIGLKFNLN